MAPGYNDRDEIRGLSRDTDMMQVTDEDIMEIRNFGRIKMSQNIKENSEKRGEKNE